jgi:hypothetical protein
MMMMGSKFADVFMNRIEAEYPDVKTIVIFAHAAR